MLKRIGRFLERVFDWLASILDPESKVHVLTLAEVNADGLHVHQWKIPDGWSAFSTVLNSTDYNVDKDIDIDYFLDKLAAVPSLLDGQEYSLCFDEGKRRILVKVF